jgi:hypothetical protein
MSVALLCLGITVAIPASVEGLTPHQKCFYGVWLANGKFRECVQKWLAKGYGGADFQVAKLAKCRENIVKAWSKLEVLEGTSCAVSRWVDNGATVTDNLTGLVWEKKTDDGTIHDWDNLYTFGAAGDGDESDPDGTAYTGFLAALNAGSGFEDVTGWRLPTLAELLTIVDDVHFPCQSSPCVDSSFGLTQVAPYISGTADGSLSGAIWHVDFQHDHASAVASDATSAAGFVRAVRGGF